MKQIKRFFAIILSLSILVTLLPSIALTANAAEQWLWPAEGCYVVSSNFGHRKWWSSADQAWREDYHKGIDIVGDNGTLGQPVRATKSGTIYDSCNTIADNQHISGSRGNFVAIDHGDGTCSMYMHLRPYNVKTSGSVQQGEIIGYIGNTGDSDGAHLHFQLYTNRNNPSGSLINPMPTNSQIRIDNKSSYAVPSDWPQDWITYVFDVAPSFLTDPVVFNLEYYKSTYSDLREAFGDNDAAYINHWLTDGAKNGRCASPCFYSAWYLNYYQDIEGVVGVGNYIAAIEHFVKTGISEGRMGSSEFYVGVYRENFLDLQQAFGNDNYPYFIHYINSGQKEGRLANERMKAFFDPNGGSCSIESMPITSVANYGTLPVATKAGCTFLGWYTLREGGEHITADSQVRVVTHQTLYAHWANNCSNGHSYTYKVTTTPTTSAAGMLTGTCSRCTSTTTVTLPKLNTTDYTYAVTKAATCNATGTGRYTWKTTTYGTFYFDVTIAKTAHSYKTTVTAPTCTEQGYTTHTCSGCGDSYKDTYTDALGHDWDDGVVTTKPTETTEGVKTFTCVRCGATRTESVPTLDHTHSYTAVVTVPTCTEKGYTTYTCACGDSYITDYVGALGHNFVGGVCTRCGEKDPDYDPSGDPCEGYTDINGDSWYHSAADFVIARGIMGSTRTDALTFEPGAACTRGMIVSILYRLSGSPKVTYEAKFPDVKTGQWYTDAVIWAYQNGIVSGYGDGTFGPNDKITREQMAVILKGYADFKGIDTSKIADLSDFPDCGKVTWSKAAVRWAVAEGLISGKSNNGQTLLDPQGNATRAEVASILMRFIQNILEK